MKKSKQGDIQVLLSGISMTLTFVMLLACGKITAVQGYVDPITLKQENPEETLTVFEEIKPVEETTLSGTLDIQDPEEVEEDIDPLEIYAEIIDTDFVPLPNSLSREYITINSDLHVPTCPSAEVLNKLIDWWAPRIMENRGTPFVGHGEDLYAIWEMTGMDPLIILGIAAWEGGWGNSKVAKAKYNFYGIGVYDSDPMYWASRFGDPNDPNKTDFEKVSDGLINGALWIYENYYIEGNTTLALINNNGYNGYNGGTYWAETISEQMINVHYRVVADLIKEDNTT